MMQSFFEAGAGPHSRAVSENTSTATPGAGVPFRDRSSTFTALSMPTNAGHPDRADTTSPLRSPVGGFPGPWSPTAEEAARLRESNPLLRRQSSDKLSGTGNGSADGTTSPRRPGVGRHESDDALGAVQNAFAGLNIKTSQQRLRDDDERQSIAAQSSQFQPSLPQNNRNIPSANGSVPGEPTRRLTLPPLQTNFSTSASNRASSRGENGQPQPQPQPTVQGNIQPPMPRYQGPQSAAAYVPPIGHAHSTAPRDSSFVSPVDALANRAGFTAAPGAGAMNWMSQKEKLIGRGGTGLASSWKHGGGDQGDLHHRQALEQQEQVFTFSLRI